MANPDIHSHDVDHDHDCEEHCMWSTTVCVGGHKTQTVQSRIRLRTIVTIVIIVNIIVNMFMIIFNCGQGWSQATSSSGLGHSSLAGDQGGRGGFKQYIGRAVTVDIPTTCTF